MKYKAEIEINSPIEKAVALFDNPENMGKWMEGLLSFEHISGEPGQPGAKARLKFQMGKREVEMIETITVRNLPGEFTGTYKAKGVFNIVRNSFSPLPGNRTRYETEQEFRFSGFMKIFAFLMPGAFKKQSLKYLEAFKHYVETQP
jgi:uncharacterized membrane protein